MRLGFYGNYTKETAEFAHKTGFRSMELSAWPESSLNADRITDAEIAAVCEDLRAKDIEISALGFYPNYLSPDQAKADEAARYFIKVMDLAKRMGVEVVSTFVGRDPGKTIMQNFPLFKEKFSYFVDEAAKRGLKIAIENCPMMGFKTLRGMNMAYSPEIWDKMFALIPAENFGLEIDPAHMIWQGIDYIRAVHDFGSRIFHAHAKDTEVRKDVLARCGIFGVATEEVPGFGPGWWVGRAPGWGDVDWKKFITALLEVGYRGNLDIEHEDYIFAQAAQMASVKKADGSVKESDIVGNYGSEYSGLRLGYNALSGLIPKYED